MQGCTPLYSPNALNPCCKVTGDQGCRKSATPHPWSVYPLPVKAGFVIKCCGDERSLNARRVNLKNFFAELKRRKADLLS
jgi:hypothetical protein